MDFLFDNKKVRKNIIEKRDALSKAERTNKSAAICNKLFEAKEYLSADNVLVYASMGSEVETDSIIIDALSKGKKVFCPKVLSIKNRDMKFVQIGSLDDFKEGYAGIREPDITRESVIFENEDSDNTLVIMPGTVFDRNRNRIGYGGGFYDTFLAECGNASTIALAYDVQILDSDIAAREHDIKPKKIITEKALF